MKIYHKVDYWKGYIPSDKVHYNHIPFENFSLKHFGVDGQKWNSSYRLSNNKEEKKDVIARLKLAIKDSQLYKDIVKEGYHNALYLNLNMDGIDCFISR